jgi:hypothetical protein
METTVVGMEVGVKEGIGDAVGLGAMDVGVLVGVGEVVGVDGGDATVQL